MKANRRTTHQRREAKVARRRARKRNGRRLGPDLQHLNGVGLAAAGMPYLRSYK